MEELSYADRVLLRHLLQAHLDWPLPALAAHIGRSLSWVKKWVKRLRAMPDDDWRVMVRHTFVSGGDTLISKVRAWRPIDRAEPAGTAGPGEVQPDGAAQAEFIICDYTITNAFLSGR